LICTYDPDTKGGYAPDGRKVKATIHWVSANNAIDAEIRLYDRLFTIKNPAGQKGEDFKDYLNPKSLEILNLCKIEPDVQNLKPLDRFQFERLGYFCIDPDTTKEKLIINRTATLRDIWAKIQKRQQKNN
jgi:glutaminyl-tRNA synthetase